ncbi:MAG: hypothetical protein ACKO1F_06020 [Flammeovirgaceae bacterium]
MKKFTSILSFFCILLLSSNCSNHNEVKSPEQQLIEKINFRLENRDFVKSHNLVNPYNQISDGIRDLRKFVNSHPQFKAVSNFTNVAGSTVLGMQNPNDIQLVKSSLQEYYQQTGGSFSESDFYSINDRLNR